MRGIGLSFPVWLTTATAPRSSAPNPDVHGLLETAPHVAGIPILVNLPAFGIVMVITWLLLRGARESVRANNIMVVVKLAALALFIAVGAHAPRHAANYTPFAPNGFTGIHQGAAIVFFAYIGFDAISTAAEETSNPQRNLPDRHPRRAGDLHGDLRDRRRRAHRHGAVHRSSRWPTRSPTRCRSPASRPSAGSSRSAPPSR